MRRTFFSSPPQQHRDHSCRRRPAVSAAVLLAALLFMIASERLAAQMTVATDGRIGVSYAVKFLCGGSSESFQEGVVRGVHATAIHILNPSFRRPVRFAKRVSRALPYRASGTLIGTQRDEIGPNQAIEVECNEIRQMLPQQMTEQFRSGFLLITSTGPLIITAVYTSRPHGGDVSTIDVETVSPIELREPPDDQPPTDEPRELADLLVEDIIGATSCPGGGVTCTTTARIRIANFGSADAGPFSTRVVFDPSQSVTVDRASPTGLAAGATDLLSVSTPLGRTCLDPECEICVTVDFQDTVPESDETNNQLCRVFSE
jgi:hypothetical protein